MLVLLFFGAGTVFYIFSEQFKNTEGYVFSGYDCTLLGYLFATLGFSFSFFRLNLMDTITLAREQAVDYIHCGLLVYDNRNKIIYHNALADRLEIEGKAAALAENAELYLFEDRIYSVENRKIEKDNIIIYGHMFFIQDMTKHYHYERRLEEEKWRADGYYGYYGCVFLSCRIK